LSPLPSWGGEPRDGGAGWGPQSVVLMIATTPNFANANTQLVKQPRHVFQISGYSRTFTFGAPTAGQDRWILEMSSPSQKADDLNGSSTFPDLDVSVVDKAALLTADVAANTLEGKVATLKTGFQGLADAACLTAATRCSARPRRRPRASTRPSSS